MPLAGICAGGGPKGPFLPRPWSGAFREDWRESSSKAQFNHGWTLMNTDRIHVRIQTITRRVRLV